MDNASKALIMAGAILISVAIVGIGIYIFTSASTMTNGAIDQMSSIEVQTFNSRFFSYATDNTTISGTQAKALENYCKSAGITPSGSVDDTRARYTVTYSYDTDGGKAGSGYITGITFKAANSDTTPTPESEG